MPLLISTLHMNSQPSFPFTHQDEDDVRAPESSLQVRRAPPPLRLRELETRHQEDIRHEEHGGKDVSRQVVLPPRPLQMERDL